MNSDEIVIALVGQPNSGKSTLFNVVSGFFVDTGNFPGTTIKYTKTTVNVDGTVISLIDLPGIYSITSFDPAEKITRDFLLSEKVDVAINVVDTSLLARSLELTLQLLEMRIPMVVALNMYDEAEKKGTEIDIEKLKNLTGLEMFPVVAVKSLGIKEVFRAAVKFTQKNYKPILPVYDRDVEECIAKIEEKYPPRLKELLKVNSRFVIIRILEMDEEYEKFALMADPEFLNFVKTMRNELAEFHNWPEESVFSSHRHAIVLDLFEKVATVKSREKKPVREIIDDFIINPIGGIVVILISLLLLFSASFFLGNLFSSLIEAPLYIVKTAVTSPASGIIRSILEGLFDGFAGGFGIVIPYLVPLLLLFALYEDSGLLTRISFMVDGILHRFGLHGKSVLPLLLGYGCNVPAIMATRTLESERDRLLTILLAPFIVCSARTVVILALVGKYLGVIAVLFVYLLNIAVTLVISRILSRYRSETTTGIIMDVPPLRLPYPEIVFKKVWMKLYDFLLFAWPIIIISSLALSILNYVGIDSIINQALSPITTFLLKLPEEAGITLFLGIFRKELTLIMLNSALHTRDVSSILSNGQLWVLTIFIVFYIPCLATITTTIKEAGIKIAGVSVLLNLMVAIVISALFAMILV